MGCPDIFGRIHALAKEYLANFLNVDLPNGFSFNTVLAALGSDQDRCLISHLNYCITHRYLRLRRWFWAPFIGSKWNGVPPVVHVSDTISAALSAPKARNPFG